MILAAVPMAGTALLGGNQVRCVGVNTTGEVVKAMGDECNELDQVVFTELGPDRQIRYSGAESVEFRP